MTKQDQQRAERILEYIRETVADHGYPPTVREIAEAVGLASTSAVHHHLTKLEKDGRLQKQATRSRALTLPDSLVGRVVRAPIVGEIAAGSPIYAYPDRSETLGVPAELAGRGRSTYVLRVRGKSMIED
ncbi:MAG: S24 family peptidase, partial [Chloroflexota bacterium]